MDEALLRRTADLAIDYLRALPDRHVGARAAGTELRAALAAPLPEAGEDPRDVLERLARDADPGLTASAGPRYFGFVVGGSVPAALAADWLVSTWDQNAGAYAVSPASAVIEEVAARWVLELLDLPRHASVGFVTGAQMAHVTALAAARHAVLRRVGWDVEADGLGGAPPVRIVIGDDAHVTVPVALRILGLGAGRAARVPGDDEGRMQVDDLTRVLEASDGPTIVCAQAGNVNTGAADPLAEIAEACAAHGAWLHIDGAFGLWAAASRRLRGQVDGAAHADSWTVDAHKWLNVPYDCGMAIVAHPDAHRAAMTSAAPYVPLGEERESVHWNPEFSRRARAVPVYAAIRSLGRRGVEELVERCCGHARRTADRLAEMPEARVLSAVTLNQVLVRFEAPGIDGDAMTASVIRTVQDDGTCWLSGTTWRGRVAMRVSFSNWSTADGDVDRLLTVLHAAVERSRADAHGVA